MLKEAFHVAVPTAFYDDETLNVQGTIDHIRDLYQQGVKSVLVSGTTGEQHSLTLDEKIELLNGLVSEAELMNHMKMIFGVSSIRQKEAEELAEEIRHTPISGIMLGYPPYVVPTQEEALVYSEKIINLSQKPVSLYNNPERTGFDLSAQSMIQLSKTEFVMGIKDAGGEEKVRQLKNKIKREDFYFYAGGEADLEEKVSYGINRLSSIAGNVAPAEIAQWFHNMLTHQNMTEQENAKIETIMAQVYQGNPIVNVKDMMNQKGIPMGICRRPIGNR